MRAIPLLWIALLAALASCAADPTRTCSASMPCGTQGGVPGMCFPSPASDDMFCAYEDSSCESGHRFGVLAGDGVASTCVPPSGPGSVTLTVSKTGNGGGVVLSQPAGIACGATCTATFPAGTVVTLSAEPGSGSSFAGWSGACRGGGACMVTLDADKTVSATFAPPGDLLWATRIGGMGLTALPRVATLSDGRVLVTGAFSQPVMLGDQLLTPIGDLDILAATLDPETGAPTDARALGGPEKDAIGAVVAIGGGDFVATGFFEKNTNLGTGPIASTGAGDSFVARFDGTSLSARWVVKLDVDAVRAAAVDGDGDVVVAGSFSGAVDFGAGSAVSSGGGQAPFVAKYDGQTGAMIWVRVLGTAGTAEGTGVAVMTSGDVVVVGSYEAQLDPGVGFVPHVDLNDVFVCRFIGASGVPISQSPCQRIAIAGEQRATAVSVDSQGYIWVTGVFSGPFSFAGKATGAVAAQDAFLARYSAVGEEVDLRVFRSPGDDTLVVAGALGVDPVVAGTYEGAFEFAGTTVPTFGGLDSLFGRIAATGSSSWIRAFGGAGIERGDAATVDQSGRPLWAGSFQGTVVFGSHNLTALGDQDVFVVSTAP